MTPPHPPAIVIGGRANAVSVARALARHGVAVHALAHPGMPVRWSRRCRWIDVPDDATPDDWAEFLLDRRSEPLRGAVLIACSDDAIEMICRHGGRLAPRYRLEEGDPGLRRALLNKLDTYRLAGRAGVPTPACWVAGSVAEVRGLLDGIRFPVIVKPQYSPDAERLGGKYRHAADAVELMAAVRQAVCQDIPFIIMEFIPGPDSNASSYYAYRDETGRPLLEFTKTHPRRNPPNMGPATYHVAGWLPETAAMGRRFFDAIGLRGLGNVEFKRDPRDGCLKLIECNARITAANELLVACGCDPAVLTYRRLIGERPQPLPPQGPERRLIFPYEDLLAIRHLRGGGAAALSDWWDAFRRADTLPYFAWSDPGPSLSIVLEKLAKLKSAGWSTPARVRMETPP